MVGHTTNACTRGVWMSTNPLKANQSDGTPIDMYVVDTEGLFDVMKDEDFNMKLTCLFVLLSSYLIFNSKGVINTISLE